MLIILSPSKTMDMNDSTHIDNIHYSEKTSLLIKKLKTFSPEDLSNLMKIKGKTLNSVVDIYKNFDSAPYKRAIEAYSGFVFREIKVDEYSQEERKYLDDHFLILSALYGALTPDSYIKEYRLDMTVKVYSEENPYQYWKNEINDSLTNLMKSRREDLLVNLASNEFSKIIDRKTFSCDIIDIDFKEEKDGKFKAVSTYAKKARGLMSNFIIVNQIEKSDDLKNFKDEGYLYNKELSSDKKYVFTRLGR